MGSKNGKADTLGLALGGARIPREGADLTKYAVIACDQYTSNRAYWQRAAEASSGSPSALSMVFPEVFLEDEGSEQRIKNICGAMERNLRDGFFREVDLPVFVERECGGGVRRGLAVALDLELYSYEDGAGALIRPTEGTITERIPPRLKVREHAPLELSHIMVLIDDKDDAVFKAAYDARDPEPLYDFELMLGGGRLKGSRVTGSEWLDALGALYENCGGMLYAMGDGNHSMATAKAHWERLKAGGASMEHPARWALCELVNLNDPALMFEPIHRAATGIDASKVFSEPPEGLSFSPRDDWHELELMCGGKRKQAWLDPKLHHVGAGAADVMIERMGAAEVDYIHGEEELERLCADGHTLGFLLKGMRKDELFPAVLKGGPLPRKTFSLGEADDKRFYMEARVIMTETYQMGKE